MSRKKSARNSASRDRRATGGSQASSISSSSALVLAGCFLLVALLVALATFSPGPKTNAPRPATTTSYSFIPGLPMEELSARQQAALMDHLNQARCSCDCAMTVAECRHRDPTCEHSRKIARTAFKLISEGREADS